MTDESFAEQAFLDALGALGPADRAAFEAERHQHGPEARRLVEAARRAAARARATPRAPTAPAEREALAAVTSFRLTPEDRAGPTWSRAALAVLGLALVAAVAAWGLGAHRRADRLDLSLGAAQARADSLIGEVAARDAAAAVRVPLEDLAPLLAARDVRPVDLAGSGGAAGRLWLGPERALLVADGLLPLEEGLGYQLWRLDPEGPAPVATLGTAPEGRLVAFLPAGSLAGARGVLVTVEPPGSLEPAGASVLERRGSLR